MVVELTVADIMRQPVETIDREATALAVANRFVDTGIGSLLVLDDGDPIGIVTDSDLIDVLAQNTTPDEEPVEHIMSRSLETIEPGASIEVAAERFETTGISKLPVLDDGSLVGIVTTTDVATYLPRHLQETGGVDRDEPIVVGGKPELAYELKEWSYVLESQSDESLGVGDVVRFRKPVSMSDVERFARATGDTARVHLDAAFAKDTRFGEPVIPGMLVAGMISAAFARLPGMTIYLSQDLSFTAPISIGQEVEAVCEFRDQLAPDRFLVVTNVYDEDRTLCVTGDAVVLVDRYPD